MTTSETSAASFGPVDPHRRIEAIDMVRGFALFGVLLVNMFNFGAYSPIWTGASDRLVFSLVRFFFETKSWRLFSLLFGLGFSLQLLRARERGGRFAPVYLRRLAVLFSIGMAHALLFPGDVLMVYVELGLLLVLFRNASPRVLLALAVALLAVFPLGRAASTVVLGDASVTSQVVDLDQARALNEELRTTHPYAVGTVADVVRANAQVIPPNPFGQPLGLQSGLGFFAMFLLGLYVGKRRIFLEIDGNLRLFRRTAFWGLTIGILGMVVERVITPGLGSVAAGGVGAQAVLGLLHDLAFAYGSTALCLGYAAVIVLLAQGTGRRFVEPFGPVGRLALTVYLTQTVAFTTVFYGYGFGQAFRLGPAAVAAIALVIFVGQVVACAWWVRRFRYGPVEWLWRALTYLELPPLGEQTHRS